VGPAEFTTSNRRKNNQDIAVFALS